MIADLKCELWFEGAGIIYEPELVEASNNGRSGGAVESLLNITHACPNEIHSR